MLCNYQFAQQPITVPYLLMCMVAVITSEFCHNDFDMFYPIVTYFTLHTSISGAIATNFPPIGGTGFIILDNVGCTGNETNLIQCQHNGLGVHDCVPIMDAGVFCNTGIIL